MKKIINLIFIAIVFIGCGGGGTSNGLPIQSKVDNLTPSTISFGINDKVFLSYLFENEYLWYDKIDTNIDNSSFTTPMDMINALRYREYDSWSYAETYQEYEDFANQQASGSFGFYYTSYFQIIDLILDSPSHKAGLQRGDIITHINDKNISEEILVDAKANLDIVSKFRIIREDEVLELNITPSIYTYKVTAYEILNINSKKIGLLRYDQFTSASVVELEKAFTYFKENNIDELIIDLRYNGGGSLATTSILMDKIVGSLYDRYLQFYLSYNDNLAKANNERYYFEKDSNSLDMKRVFFLTTEHSASASEVIINSLKPYVDVKLIGDTTHGKPVGMSGRNYGDYIYWLINFTILNANDNGEFYDGIAVDCSVQDDISYSRNSINENMLEEALYYIEYGSCKNSSSKRVKYGNKLNKI